jgi:DNA-directed RNA polymerase specialized sigma24 family protein
MGRKHQLSDETFEALLKWLDSDRDQAGQKYEKIRQSLIKIFRGRKCADPEGLADQTFNRVAAKFDGISERFKGDPSVYFLSIARFIYLEDGRKAAKSVALDPKITYQPDFDANFADLRQTCLKSCLAAQPDDDRKIVMGYYVEDETEKIASRKQLAEDMSLSLNTLRVRAHRIRERLFQCVQECVQKKKYKSSVMFFRKKSLLIGSLFLLLT